MLRAEEALERARARGRDGFVMYEKSPQREGRAAAPDGYRRRGDAGAEDRPADARLSADHRRDEPPAGALRRPVAHAAGGRHGRLGRPFHSRRRAARPDPHGGSPRTGDDGGGALRQSRRVAGGERVGHRGIRSVLAQIVHRVREGEQAGRQPADGGADRDRGARPFSRSTPSSSRSLRDMAAASRSTISARAILRSAICRCCMSTWSRSTARSSAGFPARPRTRSSCARLVDLAKNFRLKTVAEWVESEQDAALLASFGIDYFQGFFFGEPELRPRWNKKSAA